MKAVKRREFLGYHNLIGQLSVVSCQFSVAHSFLIPLAPLPLESSQCLTKPGNYHLSNIDGQGDYCTVHQHCRRPEFALHGGYRRGR